METRAEKDRLCISYNDMMSNYRAVLEILAPHCSIHLRDQCISICPIAQSVSGIPVSLFASHQIPHAYLHGCGGGGGDGGGGGGGGGVTPIFL